MTLTLSPTLALTLDPDPNPNPNPNPNPGDAPLEFTGALHTYLRCDDVAKVRYR